MYSLDQLKKMKVNELKEIASDMNIYFNKTVKKEELIKLILNPENKNETKKSKGGKKITKEKIVSEKKDSKKIKIVNKNVNIDEIPDLPKTYGTNKIVLMIRDPYNGFAYWDIDDETIKKHDLDNAKINKYLKVYDITGGKQIEECNSSFDIMINYKDNSRYINFPRPNSSYIVSLGYYKNNKFVAVLSSNEITLPRIEVSGETDTSNDFSFTDKQFEQIMQASGANIMFQHDGSQELMKFLSGNIDSNVSSGKK
jgi:hypothetical protein